VAQAWAQLDEIDPHGEFQLLKAMVDRLQSDSKLASALGIAVTPAATPRRHDTKLSEVSLGGTTVHGTDTMRIRSNTTSTTTHSSVKTSSDMSTASRPSTAETPSSTPSSSPFKGPKLVLAQNNPHLKSHRRRQSAFVGGEKMWGADKYGDIDEKKLPGHVEKGMEQQGLLSDILYGQWINGLKSRWPLT
jgi:serine/threonine-protein kinase 24/25/MST4